LDIYVYNGTHNAIEHNQEEPVLAPLSLKLKYRNGTTEFGLYRYLVPQICQHRGKAIYLDSDIVCLTDVGELWDGDLNGFDFLAFSKMLIRKPANFFIEPVLCSLIVRSPDLIFRDDFL
jgi:lipopolysaccharide biosynthesis glycosyltransferase